MFSKVIKSRGRQNVWASQMKGLKRLESHVYTSPCPSHVYTSPCPQRRLWGKKKVLLLKIMKVLSWEVGTEGHTLSRQLYDSVAWPAQNHGDVGEDAHQLPGLLDSEAVQPQRTRVTHFGRVIVVQESWVLPQNKSTHLPVFSLVPLWGRKGFKSHW